MLADVLELALGPLPVLLPFDLASLGAQCVIREAIKNSRGVFKDCDVLKVASSKERIVECSQLQEGDSYIFTSEDVFEVEVEESESLTGIPWR